MHDYVSRMRTAVCACRKCTSTGLEGMQKIRREQQILLLVIARIGTDRIQRLGHRAAASFGGSASGGLITFERGLVGYILLRLGVVGLFHHSRSRLLKSGPAM